MTAAPCPACGAPLAPWREVPSGEPSDPSSYPLSRCAKCGTAVTGGQPPGASHYETGVYAPRPPRMGPVVRALQRVTVGQPVRELERAGLAPRSRVLDVGAGRGRLVAELARRGHDARGIEPSSRSAGLAAAAGLPVTGEAIEHHADEELDAAVLWHVAEHLDDPAAALQRVTGWLRPGGLVLVAVPNIDSLQARIGGPGWLHLDAPRHRLHLTPAGLEALLDRAGLTPVRWSHAVWEHNPAGMWMALLARAGMTPGLPFHLLKRNARPTARDLALLIAGVPLAPVAAALEGAAAMANHGGTIAVVAQKLVTKHQAPSTKH